MLVAGAGAGWYGRQKLVQRSGGSPSTQAPSPASTPPVAPVPAAEGANPTPADPPVEPEVPTAAEVSTPAAAELPVAPEVPEEPESEPLVVSAGPDIEARGAPTLADEPPPAAFEDAHQEGWQDEELVKDPAVIEEIEIDPATEPDLALDEADGPAEAEAAPELEPGAAPEPELVPALEPISEPTPAPATAPPSTQPADVTRVVDDLLEGRRDDAGHEPIEDATLVEEDPDRP